MRRGCPPNGLESLDNVVGCDRKAGQCHPIWGCPAEQSSNSDGCRSLTLAKGLLGGNCDERIGASKPDWPAPLRWSGFSLNA